MPGGSRATGHATHEKCVGLSEVCGLRSAACVWWRQSHARRKQSHGPRHTTHQCERARPIATANANVGGSSTLDGASV
jgi:hypothetical protein